MILSVECGKDLVGQSLDSGENPSKSQVCHKIPSSTSIISGFLQASTGDRLEFLMELLRNSLVREMSPCFPGSPGIGGAQGLDDGQFARVVGENLEAMNAPLALDGDLW